MAPETILKQPEHATFLGAVLDGAFAVNPGRSYVFQECTQRMQKMQ